MESVTLTPDVRHLIETTFSQQRAHAPSLATTDHKARIRKLDKMLAYLKEERNMEALFRAMHKDLRKPEAEVVASEVGIIEGHIRFVRGHLKRWMYPRRVPTPLPMLGTSSYIHYEPKGVCLILAPWNYPLNLALIPLVYAIAAGNVVILKPSEISAHVSGFIKRMIGELFDDREVAVFEGDASVAEALLELPFNHIFFTGSPEIGKRVMAAAAEHLASVTLELGGKSPAIVHPSANLQTTAARTAWGKCFNTGQTCIAPDYLIVHESVHDAFIDAFRRQVDQFYRRGDADIQASPDYGRIINESHFDRLRALFEDALEGGAEVALGGAFDEEDLYIAPTLLTQVRADMRIMREEIFGPLLPVMTYREPEEAIELIRSLPKPLTMYINARDKSAVQFFIDHSTAGGTIVNDYLLGYNNPHLPFGGVNNSGIGKSLGHHGFVEFSNERGIIKRRWGTLSMVYPPYTERIKDMLHFFFRLF